VTNTTNVRDALANGTEAVGTVPVTRQQPSVGKMIEVAWNPLSP
jgi:hypothetical protein